jgi:hypothetical protein
MFAAIRRYELGAGSVDDFMRIVEEGLAESLSREPGFVGYHVVASGRDTIVSVTLFRDEESVVRSTEIATQFVHAGLQRFQPNLVLALSGEVTVARSGSVATHS